MRRTEKRAAALAAAKALEPTNRRKKSKKNKKSNTAKNTVATNHKYTTRSQGSLTNNEETTETDRPCNKIQDELEDSGKRRRGRPNGSRNKVTSIGEWVFEPTNPKPKLMRDGKTVRILWCPICKSFFRRITDNILSRYQENNFVFTYDGSPYLDYLKSDRPKRFARESCFKFMHRHIKECSKNDLQPLDLQKEDWYCHFFAK